MAQSHNKKSYLETGNQLDRLEKQTSSHFSLNVFGTDDACFQFGVAGI